ncbi:MAG: M50 family metallopeptidase [Minisyncoccales bacterium]
MLYRAKWGIKLIDYTGSKYKKTLSFLSYISILTGYLLMIGIIWLFGRIFWMYVTRSAIITQIKIPPIMPIIPYIDKFVPGFPPFYFIYFIVILAIIAISHEFAHGIFMRRYGIKIKSTGFGFFPFFFPVFLAAFVEQDDKSFGKASKFKQMAVLSAGTFANFITGILFFFIALLMFSSAFAPAGVVFDDYAYTNINTSQITRINGQQVDNPTIEQISELVSNDYENDIQIAEQKFVGIRGVSSGQLEGDSEVIQLYLDSPAINKGLEGVITEIDNQKIKDIEDLSEILSEKSPGEEIEIITEKEGEKRNYEIVLEQSPFEKEDPWLGVYFFDTPAIVGDHRTTIPFIGEGNTFYKPSSDFVLFTYNLFEWLILISISVALVNMLPVGIFDGGRFFYLTIWGITKNEKFARKSFDFMTKFFLFAVLVMMIAWVVNLIL